MPNDFAPPPEESHPTSTLSANQTMAAQDGLSGSCPDEGHTRPEVLCGTGELSGDRESPWDMFTQEPALLGRRSTSDSNDPEQESQSLLKKVPPIACSNKHPSPVLKADLWRGVGGRHYTQSEAETDPV